MLDSRRLGTREALPRAIGDRKDQGRISQSVQSTVCSFLAEESSRGQGECQPSKISWGGRGGVR